MWHHRLAHIGERAFAHIHNNTVGAVVTKPTAPEKEAEGCVCVTCALSKSKVTPFPHASENDKLKPGECVAMDFSGPAPHFAVPWLSRRYIHVSLDVATRWADARITPSTGDAVHHLNAYAARVGFVPKKVLSDGGASYTGSAFRKLCAELRILCMVTTADSPQMNGSVEQRIYQGSVKTRAMMIDSGLPPAMWGLCTLYAHQLLNVTPMAKLNWKTPHEVMFGRKPNISWVRRFGCLAFAHLTKQQRQSAFGKVLARRATAGIFVGFDDDGGGSGRGWRIFFPDARSPRGGKVRTCRSVIFDERRRGRILLDVKLPPWNFGPSTVGLLDDSLEPYFQPDSPLLDGDEAAGQHGICTADFFRRRR
jgi:transposase InsO family protein